MAALGVGRPSSLCEEAPPCALASAIQDTRWALAPVPLPLHCSPTWWVSWEDRGLWEAEVSRASE